MKYEIHSLFVVACALFRKNSAFRFFYEDHGSFKMKYKRNGREETTESKKRTDLTDVLLKPFFLYEEGTVRAQMQKDQMIMFLRFA